MAEPHHADRAGGQAAAVGRRGGLRAPSAPHTSRPVRPLLYRILRLVLPVTRPFSHTSQAHKRHRFYFQLLLSCLVALLAYAMPRHLRNFGPFSYSLVLLVLVFRLGAFSITPSTEQWLLRAYRLIGLATFASQLFWSFTPLVHRGTGLPLLVLWSTFAAWSTLRLVRLLAMEVRVNGRVLMGAVAGYLMIGITAGLLLAVLETIHPGSFQATETNRLSGLLDAQLAGQPGVKVWQLDFERLTYFAFTTVTTVGYGDITPTTPQAQMLSMMFAIIGPIYIAVVMGVLISRLTVQTTESMELAREHSRPLTGPDQGSSEPASLERTRSAPTSSEPAPAEPTTSQPTTS